MLKAAAPLICKLLMIYPKAMAKTGSVIATVNRPGEAECPYLVGTFEERDLHEMRATSTRTIRLRGRPDQILEVHSVMSALPVEHDRDLQHKVRSSDSRPLPPLHSVADT